MPRLLSRLAVAILLGLSLPLRAHAGDVSAGTAAGHPARPWHLRECLSILDLTEAQKADIQGILETAKPALQADAQAVRAAREALRAAADAVPADACAVGSDFLALRAALEELRGEFESVRGQVIAKLTTDQRSKLAGCLEAPEPDAAPSAEAGAVPATGNL